MRRFEERGRGIRHLASPYDSAMWGLQVAEFFREKLMVPTDFARDLHLKNYYYPKVSAREQILNVRALQRGGRVPFNEEKVRDFISKRFNMWNKSYMDWIRPILLVRSLVSTSSGSKSNKHDIKLTQRKRQRADPETAEDTKQPETEVKLTFLAKSVTSLEYDKIEDGHWLGKVGIQHDPDDRPECEIVNCFLCGALPNETFAESVAKDAAVKSKKRKASEDVDSIDDSQASATSLAKKQRSSTQESQNPVDQPAKKRGRPRKNEANAQSAMPEGSTDPPKPGFRLPTSVIALLELLTEDHDNCNIRTAEMGLLSPSVPRRKVPEYIVID